MSKKKQTATKRVDTKRRSRKIVRVRGPRSRTLPGMAQVRLDRLDRLCEDIGELRDDANRCRTQETGAKDSALRLMHDKGVTVYMHAGLELVRVPGSEKLRVRRAKDEGDAHVPTTGEAIETGEEASGGEELVS